MASYDVTEFLTASKHQNCDQLSAIKVKNDELNLIKLNGENIEQIIGTNEGIFFSIDFFFSEKVFFF